MIVTQQNDDISLVPLEKDIATYSWATFRADAFAGLSVALITLPQAMASALLAGLPLSCGLFAAIYSLIIAAIFGSSRHLIVGPSNAIAILIQLGTAQILFTYYRDLTGPERDLAAMQILTQLTLIVALLQIVAAWCRLGRLTQFVSHSVVIGYICAAAIAVVINQLFVFLGMPRMPGMHSLYESAVYLVTHLNETQWFAVIVGGGSLGMLIIIKRINSKIPAAVITLAIASIVVDLLGISSLSNHAWLASLYPIETPLPQVLLIGDTGVLSDVIPSFTVPFLNMRIMNGILPVAFAIALLSVMESISVAKSIAASSGQRLSTNQEIFGLGLGNIVSAFIGAMPISGGPSRSIMNYQHGSQTRFAAVLNGVFVALILFILGFFITRIPLAALAALLLVTAFKIVNMKHLLVCLKATNSDAFVLWVTLLSCLFFSLDIGFYIGVALSITLYLKKAAIPQLMEYSLDTTGELKNLHGTEQGEHRPIRVIKVAGELFFGAADLFQTTLKSIAEDDTSTRVIILHLKNARDIDATTCLAIQQLHEYLKGSGRHLIACGMTPPVWEVLSSSGLIEELGKENLFAFDERHPSLHLQKAFSRAKELIAEEPVPALLPVSEPEPSQQLGNETELTEPA
jgi:SulP family sulfate permease